MENTQMGLYKHSCCAGSTQKEEAKREKQGKLNVKGKWGSGRNLEEKET